MVFRGKDLGEIGTCRFGGLLEIARVL